MINGRSVIEVNGSRFSEDFLKPIETYSFAKIPNTILTLFGLSTKSLPTDCFRKDRYERVILLLLDGFGWRFLEKYRDQYPFLKRFFSEGIVSKLSSQFPSTTAAHITTLCSNQTVGEHGIYEWFMYEPQVNRIVAPLLYTFAGDKNLGALEAELPPSSFLPRDSFFQNLKKQGIPSHVFQHACIADSLYSRFMYEGAHRIGYRSWNEALSLLKEKLKSPGLFYLYFGDFDAEAHRNGLESQQVATAVDRCFHELEKHLMSCPELSDPSTALIVTADHGMTEIHPSTTYYLNEKIPELEKWLKRGADGHVLAPAGSCRDFFLHVEPEYLLEAGEQLQHHLQGKALVYPTAKLMEEGFFGSKEVSKKLRSRMADLAILSRNNEAIWWYEKGRFEQNFYAMHGGLTPDELETIFLFYQGSN